MGWEIVFILMALGFALKGSIKKAWADTKERRAQKVERKAHQSQLVTEALQSGVAPTSAKRAAKTGAALAVTVTSWRAIWIAFCEAWAENWRAGKESGRRLRDWRLEEDDQEADDEPESPESAVEAAHDPSEDEWIEPAPEGKRCELCGRALSIFSDKYCGDHEAQRLREMLIDAGHCVAVVGASHDTTGSGREPAVEFCQRPVEDGTKFCVNHQKPQERQQQKENRMPIETRTGGEVHNLAQLLIELDAMKTNAAAKLESAQCEAKIAEEEATQVDNIVASLRNLKVDEATASAVAALQESCVQDKALADQSAANAELKLAKATAARETAQRNHGGIREAVVASAAPAADGAFYNE